MPSLFPTAKSDPELLPFRPGLTFAFFNALAWQIGIGTPMVLFAEQLGATPAQVGLAYSFVFVLTPVQIISTALLPRYGFKALMLGGWRTRSFFLGVPAALAIVALQSGESPWMVPALVGSVFFFCLFRSIGAASGVSWFYAILPENVRGRYLASDQFVSAVGGVGTLLASAALFWLLPVYWALLVQYAIALMGSTVSYYALKKLPDAERPTSISLRTVMRDTPRHLFRRSTFRNYVWLAVLWAIISTPIPPFAAYYLKVGPRLSTGQIMLFEVLRYSGVMVAAWVIRRRIDETGARPFFLLALGLYAIVAAYWWFYLESGIGGVAGVFVAYFLLGLGVATWTIANLNYLPKIVSLEERTLSVAIQGAVSSCIGGLSPVIWGVFLKTGEGATRGLDSQVFQWFFVSVVVVALVISPLLARLPEEKGHPVDPIIIGNAILRPFRAATYLVNLVDPRSLHASRERSTEVPHAKGAKDAKAREE
jgi:MFS family permease